MGASAAASYAPDLFDVTQIDFAVPDGIGRRSVAESVAKIGFRPAGRLFTRDGAQYALHFSSGPNERILKKAVTIENARGSYRTLELVDAVADCASGFVHWDDRQSLEVAERFARAMRERIIDSRLVEALHEIDPADVAGRQRRSVAEGRLKAALR
ncbi:MAG TPA: hypothetical protein VGG89_09450 [Candidatus Baltobacteraceae bacterium]